MRAGNACGHAWKAWSRWGLAVAMCGWSAGAVAGIYDTGSTGIAQSLEIKSKFTYADSGGARVRSQPKLSLSGRVADHLEWSVDTGYGVAEDNGGTTRGGMRNLSLAAKWRPLDQGAGSAFALAVEPEVSLPTGRDVSGIGGGPATFELPLRVSRKLGTWKFTGQVGVEHAFGHDADTYDAGVLVEHAFAGHWSCGVEWFADAPGRHPGRYHLRGNAGLKWDAKRHLEVAVLAGRSIENRRGNPVTTFRMMLEYHL